MKARASIAVVCVVAASLALLAQRLREPAAPASSHASVAPQGLNAKALTPADPARHLPKETSRPRIGAPEQPVHPMIRPGALVIEELPGTGIDLRGKTVLQAVGELLASSNAGDVASTRRAAVALRLCDQRVKYVYMRMPIPKLDPAVDARFEARFREVAVECAEALRRHGKVWSTLMAKAAEAGDRDAQLQLGSYPPQPSEGPEKYAAWKARSIGYLKALVDAGDTRAAEKLGYAAAASGDDVQKLEEAIYYFERMRTTSTDPAEIKAAERMITSIREQIDWLESL